MLRFMYQMLDFFGSVFALLSPVCIVHWLMETTQQPGVLNAAKTLDSFFHPLNAMFEPCFRPIFGMLSGMLINPLMSFLDHLASMYGHYDLIPSMIPYDIPVGPGGQTIPITQGLLGLMFTAIFFVCTFSSQLLKATEQRLDITKQNIVQQHRMNQLQAQQKKKDQQVIVNKSLLVYVQCNFQTSPDVAICIETNAQRCGGQMLEVLPDSFAIEFSDSDKSIRFCQETAHQILGYYATLRPMDPQPPFRMAVHSHDKSEMTHRTIAYCRTLVNYAGENQVVLSSEVKSMLDILGKSTQYKLYPLGAYYLGDIGSIDLFRLSLR